MHKIATVGCFFRRFQSTTPSLRDTPPVQEGNRVGASERSFSENLTALLCSQGKSSRGSKTRNTSPDTSEATDGAKRNKTGEVSEPSRTALLCVSLAEGAIRKLAPSFQRTGRTTKVGEQVRFTLIQRRVAA